MTSPIKYYDFQAMNTEILLAAQGGQVCLDKAFSHIRAFVRASEARFTRFSDQSELARLNRSSGSWFSASKELYEIAQQARELHDQTGGLFDPAILDALERAGYDKSMDEIRTYGASEATPRAPRTQGAFSGVELDAAKHAIRLPQGMRIDLGGIAKGWIAERAAELLAAFADWCAVNAGGDLFAIGAPPEGWEVALEDPRDPSDALAVLHTGPGAVATSSITRRRWEKHGQTMHHLIDPRTGLPANTDWLSVTVMAPQATVAEVYAKALLIAGSRQAEQVAAARSDIAFIAVDATGQLWGSEKSKEFLDVSKQHA